MARRLRLKLDPPSLSPACQKKARQARKFVSRGKPKNDGSLSWRISAHASSTNRSCDERHDYQIDKHRSRSHDAVIRVYDQAGTVIETHECKGDFQGVVGSAILLIVDDFGRVLEI
jgi:hypothetical protein